MKYLIVQLAEETPFSDFTDIANEMVEVAENTTFITLDRVAKPIAVFETAVDMFINIRNHSNAVFVESM